MTLFLLASILTFARIVPPSDHPDAASLLGRVTYVEGNVIAGATVTAYNVFTREFKNVPSNEKGWYEFAGMRQGRYTVSVRAEGYCEKWIFNVFLVRGERTHLDLTLTGKSAPGTGCVEMSGAQK